MEEKNPVGRPVAFRSVEDLENAINEYFDSDDAHIFVGENHDVKIFAPTVSGLAYSLGISTESLRRYGENDKYCATVKRAKQRIEISLEKRLMGQAVTGTIFNLKNNFGWKDQQDINHGGQEDNPFLIQEVRRTIVDPGHKDG